MVVFWDLSVVSMKLTDISEVITLIMEEERAYRFTRLQGQHPRKPFIICLTKYY